MRSVGETSKLVHSLGADSPHPYCTYILSILAISSICLFIDRRGKRSSVCKKNQAKPPGMEKVQADVWFVRVARSRTIAGYWVVLVATDRSFTGDAIKKRGPIARAMGPCTDV